ncbi:hypothetical protein GCM10018793_54820 [Streptomyces sulfonofaciens]|uniref:Uncharacterized protein n=1 Tax=Streptomyces sulfonofaciens TaxID=68272 RepID=A0A919GJR7_9ACTN|nr:hypothetical protein [Streptomyces sulfonofaciens]GHH85716.1 hypothetical protein GCM10018793_54820 [Streptomyces sulfonofaciens]
MANNVMALRFGKGMQDERPLSLNLVHARCGAPAEPAVRCTACHDVPLSDVVVTLEPR